MGEVVILQSAVDLTDEVGHCENEKVGPLQLFQATEELFSTTWEVNWAEYVGRVKHLVPFLKEIEEPWQLNDVFYVLLM